MLKYQVRTLGRGEKRRQSTIPIKDLFKAVELQKQQEQVRQEQHQQQQHQQLQQQRNSNSSSGSSSLSGGGRRLSADEPDYGSDTRGSPWQQHHHHVPGRHLRARGRSTSVSSLSSTSTSSESSSIEWGQIRVYTSVVRSDTTYFTLFINTATTTEELIQMAVTRLRMRPKDPQLFYLTMELETKQEANDVRNALVLDPLAKPLELQACHPKEKSKFVLMVRQSYPVKIYDYCLSNTSNYKSLLITQCTSCMDAIKLILQMHKLIACKPEHFVLVIVDDLSERILHPDESLFNVCQEIDHSQQQIHIKPLTLIFGSVRTMDAVTFAQLTSQFGEFVL